MEFSGSPPVATESEDGWVSETDLALWRIDRGLTAERIENWFLSYHMPKTQFRLPAVQYTLKKVGISAYFEVPSLLIISH